MMESQRHPTSFSGHMRRAEAARYLREKYGIPCASSDVSKIQCERRWPRVPKGGQVPDLRHRGSQRLGRASTDQIGPFYQ
jgi:hypothetical protein